MIFMLMIFYKKRGKVGEEPQTAEPRITLINANDIAAFGLYEVGDAADGE